MEMLEQESFRMLFKAMLSLENEEECAAFLEDLMTRKEMEDVAQRLAVAKMLSEQAVYSRIVEKTGASTATICRVSKCLNYGAGGYRTVLARMEEEK